MGVVLVAAFEVVFGVYRHVAGRHFDVLVVRDVHSSRVVHLVVCACGNRERRNGTLTVVKHRIHIGWKHTLVCVVHLNCGVCPPQESLRQIGAVRHTPLDFQIGTAWTQGESRHSLLVEHPFHLVHPYSHAAVLILLNGAVHSHVGRRTVVLRPVEFNTSADPRTEQTYEGRFDYMVVVDEMALLHLVVGHLHTSSQFGKYHHLDIFVFQKNSLPFLIDLLVSHAFYHLIGIDHSTGTLIHSFLKKNWILFRCSHLVCGNNHRLFPCFYHCSDRY